MNGNGSNLLKRILLTLSLAMVSSAALADCFSEAPLRGVNLAGAEFNSKTLPGVMYKNYTYPKDEELDYFADKGATVIRLPVRWERLQHELGGDLESGEVGAIKKVLAHAETRDLCLIVDLHNYGTYNGDAIDSPEVGMSAYISFWKALAKELGGSDNLAFGLMNEPFKLDVPVWGKIAKKTLSDLRGAGVDNLIFVAGGRWSGLHEWFKSYDGASNAETFEDLRDPLDRMVIEVHQYADSDYSGTHDNCKSADSFNGMFDRISDWAEEHDQQLFTGEFGVPPTGECLETLNRMLSLMTDSDNWRGWSYWAAGGWWGDYAMSVHPQDGKDKPQMAVLEPYLKGISCKGGNCPGAPQNVRVDD